jgi:hypothetical protein
VSGADNQQERLTVEAIPSDLGSFLSGFALGEASFMLICRRRGDYGRKWKVSAAFNVSQKDRAPLELFRDTLCCGTIRRAGNGGWYWEVNRLSDIASRVVPFFDRFPLVGKKAEDYALFRRAVTLLSRGCPERYRLRRRSRAQRRHERRRKETLHGSENPQRLYADLSREHGEMR